jgi:hypothetical protein
MFRHILSAAALATLTLATPALAQTMRDPPRVTAAQSSSPNVDVCVAEMHRMAGLDKTLAANWNAEHISRDCAAGVYGM